MPLEVPFPPALSLPCALSSAVVETKVEKCLEEGTRGRAAPGGLADAGLCVVVVVVGSEGERFRGVEEDEEGAALGVGGTCV